MYPRAGITSKGGRRIYNRWVSVGVILVFIGAAIAPGINFNIIKASNDNDLVEVTTQACGVKRFGNTTVKLTREQYQNLEQYLVDFRARLNQTTTREEAVPIFKEAVVELNKYGLLPKGMSVDQAKKFVTMSYQGNSKVEKLRHSPKLPKAGFAFRNIFCLLLLHSDSTEYDTEWGLLSLPFIFFFPLFFWNMWHFYNVELALLFLIPTLLSAIIGVPSMLYNLISPLKFWVIVLLGSTNQAWSIGLMGYQQIYNSNSLIGFKGLRIRLLDRTEYYVGHALAIISPPNRAPVISDISPADGEQNVPLTLAELQFRIEDADADLMNYSVTTDPPIGEGSGTLKPNGMYTIPIHGLQYDTEYTWKVEVSDNQETTVEEFSFTTVMGAPFVSNPLPKHNAQYVPIWRSNVSFDLKDYQGDLMNWTVETQPDIGSGGANGVGDGRYNIAISGLEYNTNYTWFVNATDGTYWTRRTYVFTTAPEGILVLEPSADTWVGEHSPNVNHGSDGHMLVSDKYGSTSDYDARGMVLFDLSEIPSGSTIISANLSLYYYHYDDTDPIGREITCHRILDSWDEMTVTYNTMPNSNPVECSSAILPGYFTWVYWNVTSEVYDFINGGDDNYGWMVRDYKAPWGNFDIPQQYYYSSNAVDLHPKLFIRFNSP